MWTAKTVKRPPQQPAHPQHANYWAPLTRKRHTMPHPAEPRHTNDGAPRTRKRHQQEHRPQRPTERSDPTQHAKGRTGDCPGPRTETATQRNVTRGGGGQSGGIGECVVLTWSARSHKGNRLRRRPFFFLLGLQETPIGSGDPKSPGQRRGAESRRRTGVVQSPRAGPTARAIAVPGGPPQRLIRTGAGWRPAHGGPAPQVQSGRGRGRVLPLRGPEGQRRAAAAEHGLQPNRYGLRRCRPWTPRCLRHGAVRDALDALLGRAGQGCIRRKGPQRWPQRR